MICRKILVVIMLTCVTPLRKKSTFEINNNSSLPLPGLLLAEHEMTS